MLDSFPAILTVFVTLSGEWVDAIEAGARAHGLGVARVYYVSVLLIGRFIVMNVLIAVVLNAFAVDAEAHMDEMQAKIESEKQLEKFFATVKEAGALKAASSIKGDVEGGAPANEEHDNEELRLAQKYRRSASRPAKWPADYACLLFATNNPIRVVCLRIVSQPVFETIVTAAVAVSVVSLSLDTPRLQRYHAESGLAKALRTLDVYVWPWIFGSEVLLKSVATGMCCSRGAYLTRGCVHLWGLNPEPSPLVLTSHVRDMRVEQVALGGSDRCERQLCRPPQSSVSAA